MFIPTWALLLVGIAVWLLFRQSRLSHSVSDGPLSMEAMWEQASSNKAAVLTRSPLIEGYLHDERDMVTAMELDAVRLRERFKHDASKQAAIAQDWMDYSDAVRNVKNARELLDVSSAEDAHERFGESVKEDYICIQEVGKRVSELLGDESHIRAVIERLRHEAELPFEERMKLSEARRDISLASSNKD